MTNLYIITGLGCIAIIVYIYLYYIRRATSVRKPSGIVVFGLMLLFIIGALIRCSQIYDQELTSTHYFQMFSYGILLPSFAVGIALIKYAFLYGFKEK